MAIIETTNIGTYMGLTSADLLEATGARTPADALGEPKRMSELEDDSEESDVECPTCERSFDTRRGLGQHHKATHGISIREYEKQMSDTSVECPTCDELLPSEYGMKVHHAKVHGESIAGVPVRCEHCGEVAKRLSPAHAERTDKHFCTDKCQSDFGNGGWIEREHGVSPGAVLHTLHWEHDHSVKAISDLLDKHHKVVRDWMNYRGVERRSQSEAEQLKWKQMSDEQRASQVNAAHEITRDLAQNGEHHWQLDSPERNGYGAGWTDEKKEEVREMYDRTCQRCGDPEEKHVEQYGRRLDVHHIIPAGYFDDPEKRNAIKNLVPLCYSCHMQWEGIPLKPQLLD